MPSKLFAFSALAAALAVSGCSSTGGGGGGGSSPMAYNAVSVDSAGAVTRTNGSVSANPQSGRVVVGNRTYTFSGGRDMGESYGIHAYRYDSGSNIDPNGSAIFVGNHAGAAVVVDNTTRRNSFVVGGNETSRLPTQTAEYRGLWAISDFQNPNASGDFYAGVDFDRRNIDIDLFDGQSTQIVGGGSGRVIGTGFSGDLTTNNASGLAGSHTVNGQFYGPNAEEMAGVINGRANNGRGTAGFLIGTQQ